VITGVQVGKKRKGITMILNKRNPGCLDSLGRSKPKPSKPEVKVIVIVIEKEKGENNDT
jgi:hypothetical protein